MVVIGAFVLYSYYTKAIASQPTAVLPTTTVAPTATPTPIPTTAPQTETPTSIPTPTQIPKGQYKDGEYEGSDEDAYYGNIKVKITINEGKITNVTFLNYPNERSNSRRINEAAMPILRQETITAQSAAINAVSGATYSSRAYIASLTSALSKAQ